MVSNLHTRVTRLEQRSDAAKRPPAALVLLPDCDEAAERAAFESLHGYPPALVIRCTAQDARIRPDPDEEPDGTAHPETDEEESQ